MKSRTFFAASLIIISSVMPAMAEESAPLLASPVINKTSTEFCKTIKGDDWKPFEKIKATFLGDEDKGKSSVIYINLNRTVLSIVGSCLVDTRGNNVSRVADIIIDQDGKALFIIANNDPPIDGGKLYSFPYESILRVGTDSDMVMPLSDIVLKNAKPFLYDAIDASSDEHLIPNKGYSLVKILEGNLLDSGKDVIAKIENFSIKNGKINQIIVSFTAPPSVNKRNVVLDFTDTQLIRRGAILNLQMDVNRSEQFKTYKDTIAKK